MVDVIKDIEENVEKGIEEIIEKPNKKSEDKKEIGNEEIKEVKMPKKGITKGLENLSDARTSAKELEKRAEEESTEKTIEEKKKAILEKAAKLKEKIKGTKTEELKEKVKGKKKGEPLVDIDDYVKAGIYLGTKVVTPDMKPFVYRRRADGLAIFDTNIIDEKLKEAVEFLAKFDAKDIVVVCKRQSGWKVVNKFSELTGIRIFTKKYPSGILTNIDLPDFFENELTIVCDSWLDKNALADTKIVNKKVLMICDTNNFAKSADQIIIGNNKSAKSLGIIFYLLTREYCKAKEIECEIPEMDWWISEGE